MAFGKKKKENREKEQCKKFEGTKTERIYAKTLAKQTKQFDRCLKMCKTARREDMIVAAQY